MARTFAEMAYPGHDVAVYPVEVPVRMLVADTDQLKNKRMWSGFDGRTTLASSIAVGHGAQVKGDVPLWAIQEPILHIKARTALEPQKTERASFKI